MSMRKYFKSYWFWFFVTLAVLGLLDYTDHITRDYSTFRDIYLKWFLFTVCSTGTICLSIYYLNLGLAKNFKTENLITQSVAITLAMLVHMYISGPIFNTLIFGYSFLDFKFNLPVLLIGLCIFYIIRILTYAGIKISTNKMR